MVKCELEPYGYQVFQPVGFAIIFPALFVFAFPDNRSTT